MRRPSTDAEWARAYHGAGDTFPAPLPDAMRLIERARRAWFKDPGAVPSERSAVEAHGGCWYVLLRGFRRDEVLAVYLVTDEGGLRRVRRWPASIEG